MSKYMSKDKKYFIADSKIQGVGVFSKKELKIAEIVEKAIDISRIFPVVTPEFGSLINHSWTPNCYLKYDETVKAYYVHAYRKILPGEEMTLDYRDTPWYIAPPSRKWK